MALWGKLGVQYSWQPKGVVLPPPNAGQPRTFVVRACIKGVGMRKGAGCGWAELRACWKTEMRGLVPNA